MGIILTDRTKPAPTDLVHVVGYAGQSGHGGGYALSDHTRTTFHPSDPVPRVSVLDKYRRSNAVNLDLQDATRANEAHILRPLVPGSAGNGNLYHWETPQADPKAGPEMGLAQQWSENNGGRLIMAQLAIAGSQVTDLPAAQDWNVADDTGTSLLQVFLEAYWAPCIQAAIALAGGDATKVRIAGFIWMQGFSDSRTTAEANAHAVNTKNMFTALRDGMGAAVATDIPILTVLTPLSVDGNGDVLGEIETVRDGLKTLATGSGHANEMPNVHLLDSDGIPQNPLEYPHFTADGFQTLGQLEGHWLHNQPGVLLAP